MTAQPGEPAAPLDPLEIVPMKEADLPAVLAIEQTSFPTPFSEHLFQMELKLALARLYVAKRDGRVVGYADYWDLEHEFHLINIAVAPAARQQGIGAALMAFLIERARAKGVEKIFLDVRPSNQAALALYAKFGFREIGRRKRYYQDNQEDALVLGVTLKDVPAPTA